MSEPTQAPSDNELVEILARPAPPAVVANRSRDAAHTLFPDTGYHDVAPDDVFDGSKYSADLRQGAAKNLRQIFDDIGLPANEAGQLATRAAVVRSEGKSAEVQMRAARQEMRRQFGDKADQVLNDVGKLVARDPRFSKYLDAQGLGNDGGTLVMLGKLARSQRAAGKLK